VGRCNDFLPALLQLCNGLLDFRRVASLQQVLQGLVARHVDVHFLDAVVVHR